MLQSMGILDKSTLASLGVDVSDAYAHKVYSIRAQNMLNQPLGEGELKKEASRRLIESIRRNQSSVLFTGKGLECLEEGKELDNPLMTSFTGSQHEVISLSVFSRPLKPSAAQ